MRLVINDVQIELMGDPHLGRSFSKGVPLHRRGEREAMQRADFKTNLAAASGADIHVCLGDLFDRVNVSNKIVLEAREDYTELGCLGVCLPGNHDLSRDITIKSSFQLFAAMAPDNVAIPTEAPLVRTIRDTKLVFIPWSPIMTAQEMVEANADVIRDADAVFVHNDVVAIHNVENLLPAALLKSLGVTLAVTGHDHLRRDIVMDDLPVYVTGSLAPYNHSEDPDERIYVTRTLAQVQADPTVFVDKCLRVRLQPGEVFDMTIDCLALTTITAEQELTEALADVGFEAFDFTALWTEAMVNINPDISEELLTKFREIGGEE